MRGYEPRGTLCLRLVALALRIPMRGYEIRLHPSQFAQCELRIPMRGYERDVCAFRAVKLLCYESPCGVMSDYLREKKKHALPLRIPMRGYEKLDSVQNKIDSTSYESPCGVMRLWKGWVLRFSPLLRIPMRGYEIIMGFISLVFEIWLRIPMRGYESLRYSSVIRSTRVTNPHAGL